MYRDYLQDPRPENMPILGDLYDLLRKQSEPEAQNIATALEIYVNGSLNVFNHRSNIQMDNHRVLCFQLKSLGKALKEIGLLIMQDAVWNRVTANRPSIKTTWFYIDEFHLLLKGQTGSFSVEIWKKIPKMGRDSQRLNAECEGPAGFQGRARTFSRTRILSTCSTRPRETGRFWRSS